MAAPASLLPTVWPTPGPQHVAEALARLVPAVRPLRVVVFGSVARGDARPGSDLDLLVVLPDGTDRREGTHAIRRLLGDLDVPKDVVVTTPEHLARRRDSAWHIVGLALREGQTVYERAAP